MSSRALKGQVVSPRGSVFVASCGCGRNFTAGAWAKRQLNGVQHIEADESGPASALELRTCVCGSTIAKPWKAPEIETSAGVSA